MKILFIYGTRPEAIKMAPLIKCLQKDVRFDIKVCVTGQHREMLDQVLDFFKIIPDYDLALMRPDQSLLLFIGNFFLKIEAILDNERPDLVFVQGDTSSVMAGAISAFHKKIKIAHLEAGLRTGDKYSPFPEEINRVITGHIADFHFCPTTLAIENLRREGIVKNVYNVGNTVIDALFLGLEIIKKEGEAGYYEIFKDLDFRKKTILITSHRRENFGEPMRRICQAIKRLSEQFSNTEFVFPVHLNPRVRDVVFGELKGVPGIKLIDPLDYPKMIWLMERSHIVITDSGGIQEEAPSIGKPVIVLRDVTERQEGVIAGTTKLVGTDKELIFDSVSQLLTDDGLYKKMSEAVNPYGDGTTSQKIADILASYL